MHTLFEGHSVKVMGDGPYREVVLSRPEVHNAINAGMRDELVTVFRSFRADDDVRGIGLLGEGSSFSSGGDLTEFGTTRDPAAACVDKVARSLPRLMYELAELIVVGLHGACVGAGLELAAFAATTIADDTARFRLPEVGMGLIPGMGGTVSVPARTGRSRALWMMVTGMELNAALATEWGLVDEMVGRGDVVQRVRQLARSKNRMGSGL